MTASKSLSNQQQAKQHYLEGVLGIPFTHGNHIMPLRNGDAIFPAMLSAIESANSSIIFATYVYWQGDIAEKFAKLLARKAREKVIVDLLLDSYGAKSIMQHLLDEMKSAGVNIRWFRPLSSHRLHLVDNRTHRKILVVDNKIGFTGGVGIASEWEGDANNASEWRDTHFKIEGPAVDGLRGAFFANWAETGDLDIILDRVPVQHTQGGDTSIQVIRSTTSAGWSDIVTLFYALIHSAEKSLKISTAYFVLDDTMANALVEAKQRGIEIDIMIPGEHTDQRVSQVAGQEKFSKLLDAGIRIHAYQQTMLHTKIIIVDEDLVCVGSPNFNQRSMSKDEEIALCVINDAFIQALNKDFEDDLSKSQAYDMQAWESRSIWRRISESAASILRKQL